MSLLPQTYLPCLPIVDMSWRALVLCCVFPITSYERWGDKTTAREESRIISACLGALNAFLLANGLDVAAGAARLHAAARPLLVRCWGARSRDARLRDCLVTYLHIQARLLGRSTVFGGCVPRRAPARLPGHLPAHPGAFWGLGPQP